MGIYEGVKKELVAKRDEILARIEHIEADIRREKDPLVEDASDAAIQKENDEVLDALDDASREEYELIVKAISRIDKGNYHVCQNCGATISDERLKALPYADICINCAGKI